MKTIYFKIQDHFSLPDDISLCLGYFDGLHLGHLALVQRAVESLYASAVLTFNFSKEVNLKNKKHITSIEDKIEILEKLGVDYLFVLDFDEIVKNLSPEDFIEKIVVPLGAKEVIIGEDFCFGKGAKGNYQTLIDNRFHRFKVIKIKEMQCDNKKIGTSSIIPLIENGKMEETRKLLGRYYSITNTVERGYNVGEKNNFPTANLNFDGYVVPKKGVYAVFVEIEGIRYCGFANVGTHPTINELKNSNLEVHIFDYQSNLYQRKIKVLFVQYIREERKFASLDDLYIQLIQDKHEALSILNTVVDSKYSLVPFKGIDNFKFNTSLKDICEKFHINSAELPIYGPSKFTSKHLICLELNNYRLFFDYDHELLCEIHINQRGSEYSINGIKVGDDINDVLLKDESLLLSDYDRVYYSNGFLLFIDDNYKIEEIAIYEKQHFNQLILYKYKYRISKDAKYKSIKEATKNYLKTYSDEDLKILINEWISDLNVTLNFLKRQNQKIICILEPVSILLKEVQTRFRRYLTEEKEIIVKIIDIFNSVD